MRNPLPSEQEAFRWVIIIGLGAGAVIALAVLVGTTAGVILMAALIGLAAGVLYRGSRGALPRKARVAGPMADGVHRVLVVANQTVGGRALLEEIRNRCKGRSALIRVVTPALTSSKLDHWTSDTDEALREARARLESSLEAIGSAGLTAEGDVGDQDPMVAIEDALADFPADEVIVSTHPPGRSKWLERGVVEESRAQLDLPVTHVVVDLDQEAGSRSAA